MELLRFKKNQKFCVLDFETCSLSLMSLEVQCPFSVGWIVYQGKNKIVEREDWIFFPDLVEKMYQWGRGAMAVNGWTEAEYNQRAKPPGPILDDFERYLYDPEVISVGANSVSFDSYIHNLYRKKLGRSSDWSWFKNHVDIQCLAKAAHLGITPPPIGTDEWIFFNIKMSNYHKRGLKTNLAHMCKEFQINYDSSQHHVSALYDTDLTYQVFMKQIQTMDIYI